MTTTLKNRITFSVLISFLSLLAATARADVISYSVWLDTTPLVGHAAAPFSLNVQFTDGQGSGDANNTATLSNFGFGVGGSASGGPVLFGAATGSVSSSVILTDTGFLNTFTQQFTSGSALTFMLQLTTNLDPGPQPDEFSFAILDSSGFEIPTFGPANALFLIDIDSPSPTVRSFATDPGSTPFGGGTPITMGPTQIVSSSATVPEPSSAAMLSIAIASLAILRKRSRRS